MVITNKIKISTPKLSLINNIRNPHNSLSKKILLIIDSGANIHIAQQVAPEMAPFIISKDTTPRLPDESTTESSQIAKIQLPGLIKQYRKIHIYPKMRTSSLIELGVLCDDGCTITL